MRRLKTTGLSLFLSLILLLSLTVPTFAVSDGELQAAVNTSAQYMLDTVENPQVGSIGGEWAVIGLARSGYAVPQDYWDNYYAAVEQTVKECKGVLHEQKYTEYSRVILALTAIGADPANVAGYNLLTPLGDFDKSCWQGINGPVWALIALDSGSYDMPQNSAAVTQATRQMYVDEILRSQLPDGGWSLSGKEPADTDVTGMALQALAKYQEQSAVKAATDKALDCLSEMQTPDGGFATGSAPNSESCVQVIVALCELGIDLNDSRFVKNGNSLLDLLLAQYYNTDGSFAHTATGGANQMASEQGLYAIAAALRAAEVKSSLYRMEDVSISITDQSGSIGLPGKHADVRQVPVSVPGKTFPDVVGHADRAFIDAMAERGVINGKGNDLFDPNANMTRAEFAAITVRALGLTPEANDAFTDVPAKAWYAPYVGTAYCHGIINGIGGGLFNPDGTITRQEAAVMVARAAKLCGMNTALDAVSIRNILAQFDDYVTADEWAREGLAFCCREGILDQNELDIQPKVAILRCEIARMLYLLLGKAELL